MLGSAFNPPHIGHLALAQEAAAALRLDEVLLVPTGKAPHKDIEADPGMDLRLEMTRLAAAGDATLRVSELETGREGPSYTYRTLELLSEQRRGDELVLVMGSDAAADLGGWEQPERILELADLAVASRPDASLDVVERALSSVNGAARVEFIGMPQIGVSSSMVRERVAAGRPIRYLVPAPVEELIEGMGLYR